MKRRLPDADHAVLRQMADKGVYAPEEFDEWLAQRGWAWQALDRGDYGVSLEEALVIFTMEDPVRWAETFLIEPRTGEPWRFFDYQRESLRAWNQDVVHQDGAEVGKTREITVLALWIPCTCMGFTMPRPWTLIGAPQQTHLDEIILAVEEAVGAQEDGGAKGSLISEFWMKPKRTPHTMHRFRCPPMPGEQDGGVARTYYRPAGHDGEAFRGVHVNGALLMDEAAKLKRAVQWSEFWRAGMPGSRKRVYSVPDGDRSTEYFGLCQKAVPNLPRGKPGFRLFRWPKSLMPSPFWSEARDAEFARLFNGRHSPGYVRNVLGDWGDAENPVWSWDILLPNVVDLPKYRVMKLNADRQRGELIVEVKHIHLTMKDNRKYGEETWLVDTTVSLSPFVSRDDKARRAAMRALLAEHVDGAASGVFWGGADLGESNDPTEIILCEEIGNRLRDVMRIQARGLPYPTQSELIFCLHELFGGLPHWGVDLGAAGTAVVKDLQMLEHYAEGNFDEKMSGFQFSNSVECIDETGNAVRDTRDENGEGILRAPAKHWATQCMTQRFQDVGYAMAYDGEVLNHMTNHTAREGAKWPIYSKKDDHTIDARRVQMLRKLYDEDASQVDVFSSGVSFRRNAA
ncbi:MAG TPA: hypothetical protein VFB54_07020 [Burkholderiales bacterium]|nr:hypothetical protein [Burkholderiales bacterium]